MTLLLAWAAFDDGKTDPSAVYITTDSRISWGNNSTWDYAQKVFCIPITKEIFGYCGDVMCVTQTLSQIVQLGNLGGFNSLPTTLNRVELYADLIKDALISYPKEQIVSSSNIIYIQRHINSYNVFEIIISKEMVVTINKIEFTRNVKPSKKKDRTDRIIRGSGASKFRGKVPPDTTYQAFHRFCECIDDVNLPSVGGVPQVVTIRRNGHCLLLGINKNGDNRVLGLPVQAPDLFSGINEWKNENFERWDPKQNQLVIGAKRQPKA
ncbi:hypothetical protein [Janthinobacterium sp.]|uniref:hypothetical protein n=1 Tax=Janthinobacterium sp. TaxID=1871054 RepID=UPI0025B923CB|nr:hypothetical protein [Janthinobacterium sp.]